MPRPKKNYVSLNMKVESEVMKRFNEYCEEVGQTKTLAFERIVTEHMNQHDKEKKLLKRIKEREDADASFFTTKNTDEEMLKTGIALKDILDESDINPENLEGWEDVEIE